jgi:hypothetical protein
MGKKNNIALELANSHRNIEPTISRIVRLVAESENDEGRRAVGRNRRQPYCAAWHTQHPAQYAPLLRPTSLKRPHNVEFKSNTQPGSSTEIF